MKILVEIDVQDQYVKEDGDGFGLTDQGYNVLVSSIGSLGAIGSVGVTMPKGGPVVTPAVEAALEPAAEPVVVEPEPAVSAPAPDLPAAADPSRQANLTIVSPEQGL